MEQTTDVTDEYQELLRSEFLAEYLQRTLDPPSVKVMRERRQAFFDELRPWLEPTLTKKPGYMWNPVADIKTADDGTFLVKFSPDGELFFHAWLRRRDHNPMLHGRKMSGVQEMKTRCWRNEPPGAGETKTRCWRNERVDKKR